MNNNYDVKYKCKKCKKTFWQNVLIENKFCNKCELVELFKDFKNE